MVTIGAEAMRRIDQIDTSTGEIVGGVLALIQPKRKNGFGEGWFAMSQTALKAIREAGLQGRDYEVMFALLEILDFENLIQVNQAEIAQALNMKPSHMSRSVKNLVETGVLLEGPRIGRSKTYRLNPNLGWKGSAKGHNEALRAKMKQSNITVVK